MELASTRILLVEGRDEKNLTEEILRHGGIEGVQVIDIGGKYSFKTNLGVLVAQARSRNLAFTAIGVMRDADESPSSALQSIFSALHSFHLPVPARHAEFVLGPPAVGIFILPDGQSEGAIEDLCWASVKDTHTAQCSTSFLHCLSDANALNSSNPAKTLVHAYLAAQHDPSVKVGEGALKGYWPFEHTAFNHLKEFLSSLATI